MKPQNAEERKELWDQCMKECKDNLGQEELDRVMKEFYGDIYAYFSDSYSEFSSSSSVEVLMEITDSFDEEVMSNDHNSIDNL